MTETVNILDTAGTSGLLVAAINDGFAKSIETIKTLTDDPKDWAATFAEMERLKNEQPLVPEALSSNELQHLFITLAASVLLPDNQARTLTSQLPAHTETWTCLEDGTYEIAKLLAVFLPEDTFLIIAPEVPSTYICDTEIVAYT